MSLDISYHVDEREVCDNYASCKNLQSLSTFAGLILNTTDVSGVSYIGSHGARRKSLENR